MVLGLQGRSQLVDLYGPLAEALLSQPATMLFFHTADPDAAKWIERAIGDVEYLRYRESQSQGQYGRNSQSFQREIVREPLVMQAEIMGLDPLECYVKHGNYAVHLFMRYVPPQEIHPGFVPRKRSATRDEMQSFPGQQFPASSHPKRPTGSFTEQQQQFFE